MGGLRRRVRALAAVLLLAAPGALRAQNGRVSGVVHARGRPVTGVVVHLEPLDWSVSAPDGATAVMDQHQLRFVPQILAVTPGTTVRFLNNDPILHNIFSPSPRSETFDLGTFPRSETRSFTFQEPGPHVLLCHVHPEMVGYVVVVTTPYHDVSRADGRYLIRGVPPGRYWAQSWHRRLEATGDTIIVRPGASTRLEIEMQRRIR